MSGKPGMRPRPSAVAAAAFLDLLEEIQPLTDSTWEGQLVNKAVRKAHAELVRMLGSARWKPREGTK